MFDKIVSVAPTEKYFSLTWKLTNRCNYDCMYCPPAWHNNTDNAMHSLSTLQNAWTRILEKTSNLELPYKISFSGGEVTINKNFLPFVTWLKQNYQDKIFSLLLTTNGSASQSYYSKLFESVDNVSFSFHSEHADEQKFFDTVLYLKNTIGADKFLHVNIMNEFWNQHQIPHYVKLLQDNQISHSVNEVDYKLQTRTVPIFKKDTYDL
jgi:MoaA/NifB/PqqE/SkfB family radical SAM enzyme